MEKLEFVAAAENEEHLQRHSDSASKVVGSKSLETTKPEDISVILKQFDSAYKAAIEKYGNPGRQVFAIETDKDVGTDALVSAEELDANKIFSIVREPGTKGEANIKVAIISPQDMPKTNVVHAVYGPYSSTGKGGIYTMMFGDPGEPFPRKLDENADARSIELNEKAKEYWNGKDGKGGHVFLITPDELEEALVKMEENGISTNTQMARLKKFRQHPSSPIIKHEKSKIQENAKNLGKIKINKEISPIQSKILADKAKAGLDK